ncbi:MAG: hypothetical protein Q4C85_09600 [Actinomyces sp.]|uniref:HD domain-containing protein n=1 Tax=Actinomyces sp. TaxID=29317 RepID=UPI0026DCAF02|nr:hypothetical protein [Actinomyces sp.]MDO4243990.1 hypothetical protein [Actinomyces sp.]
MGVIDAPQWLLPAYVRSVKALGSHAPVEQIRAAGEGLIEMWSTPDRRFHNLRHVIDMLARVDELQDESHNPEVMRLATWYHGCVFSSARERAYRRNGGEDEIASAAYAAQDLAALGLPEPTVERIGALIVNLKRRDLPSTDIDASALCDADLGTLAVDPQQYKKYRALVREEYAHIPTAHYLRGRLAIISRLLQRETLFSSPLGARWELPARENLEAEKRKLEDEMARLPADEEPEELHTTAGAEEKPGAAPPAIPPAVPGPAPSPALGGLECADAPEEIIPPAARRASGRRAAREGALPSSPATPAGGQRVVRPSSQPAGAQRQEPPREEPRATESRHSHAPSMESCAEDLDRLLSRRPDAGETGDSAAARARQVEAARLRLAQKLREKTEEAKVLREARTGELPPITEEIIDDGAGQ